MLCNDSIALLLRAASFPQIDLYLVAHLLALLLTTLCVLHVCVCVNQREPDTESLGRSVTTAGIARARNAE